MGEVSYPLSADKEVGLPATSLGCWKNWCQDTYSTVHPFSSGERNSSFQPLWMRATVDGNMRGIGEGLKDGWRRRIEETSRNEESMGKTHDSMDEIPDPKGDRTLAKLDTELRDHGITLVTLQDWKSRGKRDCVSVLSSTKNVSTDVGISTCRNSVLDETINIRCKINFASQMNMWLGVTCL